MSFRLFHVFSNIIITYPETWNHWNIKILTIAKHLFCFSRAQGWRRRPQPFWFMSKTFCVLIRFQVSYYLNIRFSFPTTDSPKHDITYFHNRHSINTTYFTKIFQIIILSSSLLLPLLQHCYRTNHRIPPHTVK